MISNPAGSAGSRLGTRRRPAAGWPRAARITTLSAGSLLLAFGAHLLGGGTPSPTALVAALVVVASVATAVTARRCGFPVLFAILAAEQVLLHVAFDATAPTAACAASPGHLHASLECAAMTHGVTASSGPMILAHLCATALTAALLARGEQWWWQLFDRVVAATGRRQRSRRSRRDTPAPITLSTFSCVVWALTSSPRGPPLQSHIASA